MTELSGNSLRLQWEAVAASDVVVYQIKWSTAAGEKPQEVRTRAQLGRTGWIWVCLMAPCSPAGVAGRDANLLGLMGSGNSADHHHCLCSKDLKTGSGLGPALHIAVVTLSAGSRRDSRAAGSESSRLFEDCRSVLEKTSRMKFNRDKQKVLSLGRNN